MSFVTENLDRRKTHIPNVHRNSARNFLIEKALAKRQAELGAHGEVVVRTGAHTGHAADDKYVVHSSLTRNNIWWENNVKPMGSDTFETLQEDVTFYLQSQQELFYTTRSMGHPDHFALGIEFLSEAPMAALFSQYMFKPQQENIYDSFRILHAPHFQLDAAKYGTRSDTVIATCFERKIIIIVGTEYSGEIKKSIFSVMNYLAPNHDILPMNAGVSENALGESFVYFGLSGTGKTALSTDEGTFLIGDDEHGLSSRGVFNFESGCYAKTYKLSASGEPAIYKAATRFGAILENVKMNHETRSLDFGNKTVTENGRATYPLSFIENRVESGQGKMPQDIFFLSADAFGVLPLVSLLTYQQAMDYFVLGYTAKLAGTEGNLREPKATFSPCFGAPFMFRHPSEYARLLALFLEKHNIRVWLLNTGWTGGPAGIGDRVPLKTTRTILRAIQNHELEHTPFTSHSVLNLRTPEKITGIESRLLNPERAWPSEALYTQAAQSLADSFALQLAKFRH